jgi:ribosomal protein S4
MKFLKENNRIKPLYKQFIKLRENVQNRTKILKFKRKKWEILIENYKKRLKWYKKFKPKDQTKYLMSKYASNGKSRKKVFRDSLNRSRIFRLFYGNLTKKLLKKQIKNLKNTKSKKLNYNYLLFLQSFEKRLDTTLFRAKFSKSIRNAKQLVTHGIVFVNNKQIRYPAYILKEGDFICINPKYSTLIENNLKYCLLGNLKLGIKNNQLWPLPPKHLVINYKTLEIIFGDISISTFQNDFLYNLNLEKIIINYYRQ